MTKHARYALTTAAVVAVAGSMLSLVAVSSAPADNETIVRLYRLGSAIEEYHLVNRRVPELLTELRRPSSDLEDQWGHPILYQKHAPDVVSVTSLGKDGRPGGQSMNADIEGRLKLLPAVKGDFRFSEWLLGPEHRRTWGNEPAAGAR